MLTTAVRWVCCALAVAAFALAGYFIVSDAIGRGPELTGLLAGGLLLLSIFLVLGRNA